MPRGRERAGRSTGGRIRSAALRGPSPVDLGVIVVLLAGCTTQSTTTTAAPREVPPSTNEPADPGRRARVHLELASAYFGRGQNATALDEVKLALTADPNVAAAYDLRGLIEAGLGDDRLAEENFRHALQLDPKRGDTMKNYGWFLCQRNRPDESEAQFAAALALPGYADVPRTMLSRGVCQARSGALDAAAATLARSYELDPANPTTAANLADVLYRRGEYERARFYVRRVNGQEELASAQTLWLAARIEYRLGNSAGARDFGAQLRNRFPASPQALQFERGRFDD